MWIQHQVTLLVMLHALLSCVAGGHSFRKHIQRDNHQQVSQDKLGTDSRNLKGGKEKSSPSMFDFIYEISLLEDDDELSDDDAECAAASILANVPIHERAYLIDWLGYDPTADWREVAVSLVDEDDEPLYAENAGHSDVKPPPDELGKSSERKKKKSDKKIEKELKEQQEIKKKLEKKRSEAKEKTEQEKRSKGGNRNKSKRSSNKKRMLQKTIEELIENKKKRNKQKRKKRKINQAKKKQLRLRTRCFLCHSDDNDHGDGGFLDPMAEYRSSSNFKVFMERELENSLLSDCQGIGSVFAKGSFTYLGEVLQDV